MRTPLTALLVGRFRNVLQRALRGFVLRTADIGERHDADQSFIPVEDWKAPHLVICHDLCCTLRVIVLEAVADTFRHNLSDRRAAGRSLLGYCPYDDVSIGDHADEAVVFANR